MIVPKKSVGGRKTGIFSNEKALKAKVNGPVKYWVLANDKVSFTFAEDHLTGVRLDSWKHTDSSTTFYNESRNLWTINVIYDYFKNTNPPTGSASVNVNHYNLHPRIVNFDSTVPIFPETIENGKKFTFSWENVEFDKKNVENKCRVFVIATLLDNAEHLDIKIEMSAQPGAFSYTPELLQNFNSACITSIQFPTISLRKNDDENVNNRFILSTPVAYGYTYFNPFKYLRTPRYLEESFQYTHLGQRAYAAGFPGEPNATLQRFNYGSPGGFEIPAIVFGNKDTKDGTLIYALDQEGTNPKGFQFYFDDKNLHIKTYHMSDYQVDPYGLGGYINNTPGQNYSIENKPTWTFRIRPFKSASIWLDWYGFDLYRKEAVPEQESYGWMGKSFYQRYQEADITKPAAEMPMVMNVFGYSTGTLDNLQNSISFYKDLYRTSVNPNIEGDILFPIYYTPGYINAAPQRITDPANPAGAYYGWYPWAHQGTGVGKVGPELFVSPDYTGINNFHTGAFKAIAEAGDLIYSYNLFPFVISTGSNWTKTYSGIDLCVKVLGRESDTYTNAEYANWAYNGASPGVFGNDFVSCLGVDLVYDKYLQLTDVLGATGMGFYHDTVGIFGRGCYAKEHKHYDPASSSFVTKTHPRGGFSKYFNDRQRDLVKDHIDRHAAAFTESFGETIKTGDFIFKQGAEFATDVMLKDLPVSLTYEPLGPIYNLFFNDVFNPRPDVVLNLYAGLEVDTDPSLASLLVTLGGQRFWSSFIKPPNWIQRCPAFQIALSDRCIWDEWVAVHHTNAFSTFFKRGPITGYGQYGLVLKAPVTDEYQATNWSSFTAQTWPYTNRLSTWHVDNQVEFFRPDLSGVVNDEYSAFTGIWSGYLENFTKKQLRIQAYNPDYIYHGSLQHPLDFFSSNIVDEPTESRLLRRCANPNTGNPFAISSTVDAVQHIVRKHRNENNYLIVAGNWFSGTSTFNGSFDPLTYNISNGYQVYALELNASNHGTKTLVAVRSAGEPFTFTSTLNEYDYVAYEIETNATELDPDIFGDLKTSYAPIRYSYDLLSLSTTDTTFAYSYGTSKYNEIFAVQAGFKSPVTQEILNNLPPWMKMRQSYDSNGWKITNSWGMSLENVIDNIKNKILDFSLVTANTKYLSKLDYIDIDSKEVLEPKEKRNLLFNSSFSIKDVARSKMPAGWTEFSTTKSCHLDYINTISSACSISSNTGKIKVGQQILLDNISVKNATASIYLKSDAATVNVRLHVSVEKMDGTSLSFLAQTSNRSSEWVRLILPIEINAQVYRINYSISTNCSGLVSIGAPQLELGSITAWTSSIVDFVPYLPSSSIFNSVYVTPINTANKKISLFNINTETEFLQIGIPTRVEKVAPPQKELAFVPYSNYGRKIDNQRTITDTEFTVFEDKIVERSLGPSIFDFFGKYDVRDIKFFDELEYGTTIDSSLKITPLATAIRGDYLFVACKEETEYGTFRTLKVVRPRTPPKGQTYLESFCDFDLNIKFEDSFDLDQIIDEEVASISFSEIDPSYMVVVTTNNIRYYYKLYFDYYYFNSNKNKIYTIESYGTAKITIL